MTVSSGLLKHSPLGASGAYCWMVCPGSANQSKGIVEDDSEYAVEGQSAHSLSEICLTQKREPWEFVGTAWADWGADDDREVDKEMADAVQYYLHEIGEWHPHKDQSNSWVERKFHCSKIHLLYYGMSDFSYLDRPERTLHVWDYKHGAGIVVEVEENPQGMYYAAGILEDLDIWEEVDTVVIHIVQPRGWHEDGPHRVWEVSVEDLAEWLHEECVPAMDLAEVSRDTLVGEHCRFCHARSHQCPSIMETVAELEELVVMAIEAEEKGAKPLTSAQVGRIIDLDKLCKVIFKAARDTAFKKLSAGKKIPGAKLVQARTNRIFKKGAEKAARETFGKKARTKSVLMSPAQIEALPGGKKFTARYAFKPKGSLTVASEGDPRRRVNRDRKSLFTKKGK